MEIPGNKQVGEKMFFSCIPQEHLFRLASLRALICIIFAHSWLFTVQENKIDFSFLSTFIMPVQMNVGHIPARSIFMQPTLEKARELLQSSRGSCNFFSYGFLLSLLSLKFVCIILPAHCQLQGVLMKGAPLNGLKGHAAARTSTQRLCP